MTTRREILAAALGLAVAPVSMLLPAEAIAAAPEEARAALGPARPPAGHWLLELHYHSGQTRTEVVGCGEQDCEACTVRSINVTTDRDESWIGVRDRDLIDYYSYRSDMRYVPTLRYQVQLRHLDGHLELINQPDLLKGTVYTAAGEEWGS